MWTTWLYVSTTNCIEVANMHLILFKKFKSKIAVFQKIKAGYTVSSTINFLSMAKQMYSKFFMYIFGTKCYTFTLL